MMLLLSLLYRQQQAQYSHCSACCVHSSVAVCRLCIPLLRHICYGRVCVRVVCFCVHTPRQRWARKRIIACPSCKLSTGFTLQPFCLAVILWVTFSHQTKQQTYSVHYRTDKCNHNASCIHGSVGMYALQQHVPSMLLYVGEIGKASLRAQEARH